jgi:hypothetical protein
MKKKIIILSILISICYLSYSQIAPLYKDLIELKSGMKFYGSLLEYNDGGQVKLKLANGSILIFEDSTVSQIEIYNPKVKRTEEYSLKNNVFYSYLNVKIIGAGTNLDELVKSGLGLEYSLGYRFNNYASMGLGTGVESYNYGFEEYFIPLYVDFISILKEQIVSPFIHIQGGYSMLIAKSDNVIDAAGGIMFNPAIGLKFQGNYNLNYTFDINFKYQDAQFTYRNTWGNQIYNRDVSLMRLMFRFGLMF